MRVDEKDREKERERERRREEKRERKRKEEGRNEGRRGGEEEATKLGVTDLLISGAVLLGKSRVAWVELLKTGSWKSGLLCPGTSRKGAVLNLVQIEDGIM